MLKIRLISEAKNDLETIYEFRYMSWEENQADWYQDSLFEAMLSLENNMKLGEVYSHWNVEYRKYHINKHLICIGWMELLVS